MNMNDRDDEYHLHPLRFHLQKERTRWNYHLPLILTKHAILPYLILIILHIYFFVCLIGYIVILLNKYVSH